MSVFCTCFTSSGVARVKQEQSALCQCVPSRHLFGGLKRTVDVYTKMRPFCRKIADSVAKLSVAAYTYDLYQSTCKLIYYL